jgi:hypothetical protein
MPMKNVNIKQARKELSLSMIDLANIAGVTIKDISRIERAEAVNPDIRRRVLSTIMNLLPPDDKTSNGYELRKHDEAVVLTVTDWQDFRYNMTLTKDDIEKMLALSKWSKSLHPGPDCDCERCMEEERRAILKGAAAMRKRRGLK